VAIQSPFFNKRENDGFGLRGTATGLSQGQATAQPQSAPPVAEPPKAPQNVAQPAEGSKLTVGPNIKLKGVEITDCDTLVVEGLVEATMDSRVIRIAETGAFKGSAEIDFAEIRGLFDGSLTVREKLVIHATGKVTGTIHYGRLVIEEGGQLSGQIEFGTTPQPRKASGTGAAAKPVLQMRT